MKTGNSSHILVTSLSLHDRKEVYWLSVWDQWAAT